MIIAMDSYEDKSGNEVNMHALYHTGCPIIFDFNSEL